jgi:hypothetical protein
MRQNRLQAFEQGYLDGLREAHAELLRGLLTTALAPAKSSRPETSFHLQYRTGFSEGLKDGIEVLRTLGKTAPQKRL